MYKKNKKEPCLEYPKRSKLFCRYLKATRQRGRRTRRDMNKTSFLTLLQTRLVHAAHTHPLQSLGSTLPMLGAPPVPIQPPARTPDSALSPPGCDTGGQTPTLLAVPSCETLPCCPSTQSIQGEAGNKPAGGELQQ